MDINKILKKFPVQMKPEVVKACLEHTETHRRLKREEDEAHDLLWETVHKYHPELPKNLDYRLDCKYDEQGIVMLHCNATL